MTRFRLLGTLTLIAGLWAPVRAADNDFGFEGKRGEYVDVTIDGRRVARYVHEYDNSSPQALHDTYKPYLHVFDAQGKSPITKGPGGLYTHHRGIFIGWNKIGFGGKTYDRWHMRGGEQVHQKFLEEKLGKDSATITSLVHWNDEAGKPIVEERRTMTFRPAPAPAYALIDFTSILKAPRGDVMLDGDPEHAGVHFRPANEVAKKETVYVFPKENADPKKDADYPWVGETFSLGGKKYSVVHINHPDNPKGALYSAYRDYGRFGAFFKHKLPEGKELTVKYRFLVSEGELPDVAVIQKSRDEFAGATQPTPLPKTTRRPVAGQGG